METLSIKEYSVKYHPKKAHDFVYGLIKKGNLPSNHTAKKVGNCWMIETVELSQRESTERIEIACTAIWYHFRKENVGSEKIPLVLVSTYALKYGVDFDHLKKVLGV